MRKLAALGLLLCAACVIVIDDIPEGLDLPEELPKPEGADGGGGEGEDGKGEEGEGEDGPGGPPEVVQGPGIPVPFPVPESGFRVGQLWFVRVEASLANMASEIEELIGAQTLALRAAGLPVQDTGVASLYGQEGVLLWASSPEVTPPLSLASALRAHAAMASAAPPVLCPTRHLANLGTNLPQVPVVYPGEILVGGEATGKKPFAQGVDALFVGFIDMGPRPESPRYCPGKGFFSASDPTRWTGRGMARVRTRFLFVTTPEGDEPRELRERCLAIEGFPPQAIDGLSASPAVFYGPFSEELTADQPGLATRVDLCGALGSGWSEQSLSIAREWMEELTR